jgi:5-deoxy-glucuronate isomerase
VYHVKHEAPFQHGYNAITEEGEPADDAMMDFGILLLHAGERHECHLGKERAFLLMRGSVTFAFNGVERRADRQSLLEESPVVLHVPRGVSVRIAATTDAEISVMRTTHAAAFEPRLYTQDETSSERRGAGTMGETSTRIVRTTFDDRNAPQANLVVGEVVTYPGKWSSYPPHCHPQPEIYHYRFFPEHGFGHAAVGDMVLKVGHGDTVKILHGVSHPQVAAPGYAMYYLWVIRHLDGNRYGETSGTPIFEPEHLWVTEKDAPIWPG